MSDNNSIGADDRASQDGETRVISVNALEHRFEGDPTWTRGGAHLLFCQSAAGEVRHTRIEALLGEHVELHDVLLNLRKWLGRV